MTFAWICWASLPVGWALVELQVRVTDRIRGVAPMTHDDSLFTAQPADDGTDAVLIKVDARTALQLATAWDHTHVTIDTNAIDHPLWWWDVAALRRAAADASAFAVAAEERVLLAPTEKARATLRLVEVVQAVKTS